MSGWLSQKWNELTGKNQKVALSQVNKEYESAFAPGRDAYSKLSGISEDLMDPDSLRNKEQFARMDERSADDAAESARLRDRSIAMGGGNTSSGQMNMMNTDLFNKTQGTNLDSFNNYLASSFDKGAGLFSQSANAMTKMNQAQMNAMSNQRMANAQIDSQATGFGAKMLGGLGQMAFGMPPTMMAQEGGFLGMTDGGSVWEQMGFKNLEEYQAWFDKAQRNNPEEFGMPPQEESRPPLPHQPGRGMPGPGPDVSFIPAPPDPRGITRNTHPRMGEGAGWQGFQTGDHVEELMEGLRGEQQYSMGRPDYGTNIFGQEITEPWEFNPEDFTLMGAIGKGGKGLKEAFSKYMKERMHKDAASLPPAEMKKVTKELQEQFIELLRARKGLKMREQIRREMKPPQKPIKNPSEKIAKRRDELWDKHYEDTYNKSPNTGTPGVQEDLGFQEGGFLSRVMGPRGPMNIPGRYGGQVYE